jgi:GH35 family endo-1,4-beta-xylanase
MNESLGGDPIDFLGTGKSRVEVIADVFQWAKETYPEGKYMWNEHSPSFREDTRNEFLQIVREVQARGVSPDIIGLQAHMGYRPRPFKLPPDQEIRDALTEIHGKIGVPLQITEFDLSWNNNRHGEDRAEMKIDPKKPITVDGIEYKTWFEYQAYAYRYFVEICRDLVFVEGFYYYAFNENEPWERPDCGLFNDDFKPRPEMLEWVRELKEARFQQ